MKKKFTTEQYNEIIQAFKDLGFNAYLKNPKNETLTIDKKDGSGNYHNTIPRCIEFLYKKGHPTGIKYYQTYFSADTKIVKSINQNQVSDINEIINKLKKEDDSTYTAVTFKLRKNLKEKINQICKKNNIRINFFLNYLLEEYLKNAKQ